MAEAVICLCTDGLMQRNGKNTRVKNFQMGGCVLKTASIICQLHLVESQQGKANIL